MPVEVLPLVQWLSLSGVSFSFKYSLACVCDIVLKLSIAVLKLFWVIGTFENLIKP